jgi:hypothetical protein
MPLSAFKDLVAVGDKPIVYHSAFVPFAGSLLGRARGDNENKLVVGSYVVPALLLEEVSLKQPVGAVMKPPPLPSLVSTK